MNKKTVRLGSSKLSSFHCEVTPTYVSSSTAHNEHTLVHVDKAN